MMKNFFFEDLQGKRTKSSEEEVNKAVQNREARIISSCPSFVVAKQNIYGQYALG